jgi:hypothetical protein
MINANLELIKEGDFVVRRTRFGVEKTLLRVIKITKTQILTNAGRFSKVSGKEIGASCSFISVDASLIETLLQEKEYSIKYTNLKSKIEQLAQDKGHKEAVELIDKLLTIVTN